MTLLLTSYAIMALKFYTLTSLLPNHFPPKKSAIVSLSKWFAPPSKRIPIPLSPSSTTYKVSTRSQWSEKLWPASRRVKLKSWSQKTNSFIITWSTTTHSISIRCQTFISLVTLPPQSVMVLPSIKCIGQPVVANHSSCNISLNIIHALWVATYQFGIIATTASQLKVVMN